MALHLDARRRAMLQEMGIAVWLPPHEAAPAGDGDGGSAARTARPVPRGAEAAPSAGRLSADAVPPPDGDGARRPMPVRADAAPGPSDRPAPAASPAPAVAARTDGAGSAAAAGSAAPVAASRHAAAAPARRPGDGPAVSVGAWQVLHDGAPRPVPAPAAGSGDADPAAPAPRALPPPRTWLLLTESSTPADLCAAQDPAGRLLAAMLRAVQHGGPVRIVGAPVLPVAAGDASGDAPAGRLAAALQEAVEQHRPALVLTLGRLASQAVLGTREPLGRLRGRLHADHPAGVPVVASYDAGYLLRAPADKARAWADLCLGLEQGGPPAAS